MVRRGQAGKVFVISFAASLAVMCIPLGASLLFYNREQRAPEVEQVHEVLLPTDAPALHVFIAIGTPTPHTVLLSKVDVAQGEILVATLPPETMVEDAGRFEALGRVVEKNGPLAACTALSNTLQLPVHRFVVLSDESLAHVVNQAGAVDYSSPDEQMGADGIPLLTRGRQLVDGRRLALVLAEKQQGPPDLQRLQVGGELLCQMAVQQLLQMNWISLQKLFHTVVNSGKNNLTALDFEARKGGPQFAGSTQVTLLLPQGAYNAAANTFLFSPEGIARMQAQFVGKEGE